MMVVPGFLAMFSAFMFNLYRGFERSPAPTALVDMMKNLGYSEKEAIWIATEYMKRNPGKTSVPVQEALKECMNIKYGK
jgi:hypothetical protein